MFNCKKVLIVAGCLTALGALSQGAMAASAGVINFQGEVTDTTCDVAVNGGAADATIVLPRVSSTVLKNAGDVAGRTFVRMSLSNCGMAATPGVGAGGTHVHAFWQASPTITTNGRLMNTDAVQPAQNVEIQMLNDAMDPINLAVGDTQQNTTLATISAASPGTAELTHYAQYYATSQSQAGLVKSKLEYVISYN
jgi:major type 1 subunit fimbrin (pilin)